VDLRTVAIYSFDDAARTICTMRLCWWWTDGRVEAKMRDCDGLQIAVAEMDRFLVK